MVFIKAGIGNAAFFAFSLENKRLIINHFEVQLNFFSAGCNLFLRVAYSSI